MPSGSLWDFLDQMRCQGGRWTWERPNQIPHSDQSRSLFCCMMDSHVLIPPLSRALIPLPPGTSCLKRHIPNKDFPLHFWFTTTLMFDGHYRRLFIQQCFNSVVDQSIWSNLTFKSRTLKNIEDLTLFKFLLNLAWMCLHVLLHGMMADVVCEIFSVDGINILLVEKKQKCANI